MNRAERRAWQRRTPKERAAFEQLERNTEAKLDALPPRLLSEVTKTRIVEIAVQMKPAADGNLDIERAYQRLLGE